MTMDPHQVVLSGSSAAIKSRPSSQPQATPSATSAMQQWRGTADRPQSRGPLWTTAPCIHGHPKSCPYCESHTTPSFGRRSTASAKGKRPPPSPAGPPPPASDVVSLPPLVPPPAAAVRDVSGLERHVRTQLRTQYLSAAEAFRALDLDRDGRLSPEEFAEAVRGPLGLPRPTTPGEVAAMFQ
eukprot:EG_transcript_33141